MARSELTPDKRTLSALNVKAARIGSGASEILASEINHSATVSP